MWVAATPRLTENQRDTAAETCAEGTDAGALIISKTIT
jgi:hypothetical protein